MTVADIKKSFERKRLIPFVGSGLSMCVDGFPSWDNLLQELTKVLERQDDKKAKLFKEFKETPWVRAEYFESLVSWGKDRVSKTIKGILRNGEKSVGSDKNKLKCQILLAENFGRVYTTNYDHLLELAAELCSSPKTPVGIHDIRSAVQSRDQRPGDILEVIKYHGDYDCSESIVLTEREYFDRLLDVDAKDMLLMSDLLFGDLLFLGYSFQDQSLKYIVRQMLRLMEKIEPKILTHDYREWRPRFFLVTTESRQSYLEYLEQSYKVSCISVLDNCTDECEVEYPSGSATKFVYKMNASTEVLPDSRVIIGNFSHLWSLAQNSYLESTDFMEEAVTIFPHDTDPTLLKQMEQKREGFRVLRSKVMLVCYFEFLKKILPSIP